MSTYPIRRFTISRRTAFVVAVLFVGLMVGAWYFLTHHSQEPNKKMPAVVEASATENNKQVLPLSEPSPMSDVKPMVVDLGGGRFSIGTVLFDSKSRTITIPAEVNMREGAVEYMLVGSKGKVHEAVFTTQAEAQDIHFAALLLKVKPAADLGPQNSAATVRRECAAVITVEWDRNGPPEKFFLNETVNLIDPSTKVVSATLPPGAWLYNGSRIEADGVFAATRSASIISIIRDDDALLNNPGATRDNDEIHTPNAAKLPQKGHPVRIILQLK
jgi:hypothetical protein